MKRGKEGRKTERKDGKKEGEGKNGRKGMIIKISLNTRGSMKPMRPKETYFVNGKTNGVNETKLHNWELIAFVAIHHVDRHNVQFLT